MTTANIIGAGNVATQLGFALKKAGVQIRAVYARNEAKVQLLAGILHALPVRHIEQLPQDADVSLIAVKDNAIAELSDKVITSGIVIHTSGITPIEVLASHTKYGVLYPLQTISANAKVNFREVPLLLEACDQATFNELSKIARLISDKVLEVKTHERQMVHLAAVFANNFTNHLYGVAYDILNSHGLSFDLLKPLIEQTAINIRNNLPQEVQTGPAARSDMNTVDLHLQLLREHVQYRQLYELLSANIIEQQRAKQ